MKCLTYRTIYRNKSDKNDQTPISKEELFVENVAISKIAEVVGTPFYCYSKKDLQENYLAFVGAFKKANIVNYKICYAIKANFNLSLVKILAENEAGIDAVSAGEIHRALVCGIDPHKIVFAGVGKTSEEIEFALKNGVQEFSVESVPEMFLLNEVATKLNKIAKFSLRVNPDIDAKTHDKISTGRKGDKFGVDINRAEEIYGLAAKLTNLDIFGISMHIGSQITNLEPFKKSFLAMRNLCLSLKEAGHKISNLDFGGGIGISYQGEQTVGLDDYAALIKETILNLDVSTTIAPGRAIVGDAGLLITKTIFIKETDSKNFVIIDAALNDLMRPGLYGSHHEILPVRKKSAADIGFVGEFNFAGPVCESTDILAKNRKIAVPRSGDLFAFTCAGAYGSSMSNEYNCRPLVPEVLVDNDSFKIIRRRPSFTEMTNLENL